MGDVINDLRSETHKVGDLNDVPTISRRFAGSALDKVSDIKPLTRPH